MSRDSDGRDENVKDQIKQEIVMEAAIIGFRVQSFVAETRCRIRSLGFRGQGVGKQAKALRPETQPPTPLDPQNSNPRPQAPDSVL